MPIVISDEDEYGNDKGARLNKKEKILNYKKKIIQSKRQHNTS